TKSERARRARGETATGGRLRFPGTGQPAPGRAGRPSGFSRALVPGAQRLFPGDRPAAQGAVSGFSRADQSEETGRGRRSDRGWRVVYSERPNGERVCVTG